MIKLFSLVPAQVPALLLMVISRKRQQSKLSPASCYKYQGNTQQLVQLMPRRKTCPLPTGIAPCLPSQRNHAASSCVVSAGRTSECRVCAATAMLGSFPLDKKTLHAVTPTAPATPSTRRAVTAAAPSTSATSSSPTRAVVAKASATSSASIVVRIPTAGRETRDTTDTTTTPTTSIKVSKVISRETTHQSESRWRGFRHSAGRSTSALGFTRWTRATPARPRSNIPTK